MKKYVYLSMLLLSTLVVMTACGSTMYQKDLEALNAEKAMDQETIAEPEPTTPDYETEYSQQETNRVAAEHKKKWQAVEQALSTLSESRDSDGVRYYCENNVLRKIEIDHETYGSRDMEFEREYYFDDLEMYFARLTNGAKEMRFYFKNGQMIRWIDASGKAYDQEKDHKEFSAYEAQLYAEAADLWSEFDSEMDIANFYIQ